MVSHHAKATPRATQSVWHDAWKNAFASRPVNRPAPPGNGYFEEYDRGYRQFASAAAWSATFELSAGCPLRSAELRP